MESIWKKTCPIPQRNALQESVKTEIAVIGAGLAGVLTAYRLKKAGKKVIVLEADRIASGQTQNTTAKITSQHGLIYHRLIETLGEKKARAYAMVNQSAIKDYQQLLREACPGHSCDFQEISSCVYSQDAELLKKEAQAAVSLGLPASYLKKLPLPVPNAGGVCFLNQAQFHPLKLIRELTASLTVYERTMVTHVEDNRIYTPMGTVTADSIVFACHYPFLNFPGLYFARMHQERSYVIALEGAALEDIALKGAVMADSAMTNSAPTDRMYLGEGELTYSFRPYGKLLLFGGEGHRTGENPRGGRYEALRSKARELFPKSHEVACWSAQDCITCDGMPFIGQYSPARPNWLIATGFGKWGMTFSMAASSILCDTILNRPNPYASLFTPGRFSFQSIPGVACEAGHAVKSISKRIFQSPKQAAAELSANQGGIVLVDGEKRGVYKDVQNNFHIVEIRCPHLGCQLEWNPDEKSWDCPCHGSRFTCQGQLLSGPAQTQLPYSCRNESAF